MLQVCNLTLRASMRTKSVKNFQFQLTQIFEGHIKAGKLVKHEKFSRILYSTKNLNTYDLIET